MDVYQKSIVMKYIDNLLDWGDALFARDTFESINEATMLYMMAADILGDRPMEVGKCETTEEELTFLAILNQRQVKHEFLIQLENYITASVEKMEIAAGPASKNGGASLPQAAVSNNGFAIVKNIVPRKIKPYSKINQIIEKNNSPIWRGRTIDSAKESAKASLEAAMQRSLALHVPPNTNLQAYWDRVEDRLYKIRQCMNLQGVRRQLALFQPPIDPGLLVRAKAAGLSLEDIQDMLSAEISPYRFSYLIEKAKQFTGTVQSFGSTLLTTLEKKDGEERPYSERFMSKSC
jgi:hypothetical protein